MNAFYKQNLLLQWFFAIILLLIGFIPAIYLFDKIGESVLFLIPFVFYIPVVQFTSTPLFRLTGVYKYYSPMLLGYLPNDVQIDLHSGTSFDYLFVMRNVKAGLEFRMKLLIYHVEGLLNLIDQIENNAVPQTATISGTSYFFNEKTLNRLGFDVEKPSLFYRVNLFANFVDLIWMFSISQGRFAIPKIADARKASIKGSKLLESKKVFQDLHKKMTLKIKPD